MTEMTFGILTVSDSCSKNEKTDTSGPKLEEEILKTFPAAKITHKCIIPDEKDTIIETLILWSGQNCNIILTTGGTGFSPRDVTPEATKAVIDREAPNMAYAMASKSLEVTSFAMLSRSVVGIRKKTLIVNLPGSAKAAIECFGFIKNALPHAVSLLKEDLVRVSKAHEAIQSITSNKHNHVCGSPSKVHLNAAMRPRHSPYPIISVPEAISIILKQCQQGSDVVTIKIEDSLNRTLAESIHSSEPFPNFPASIKDGYAVKYEDGAGKRKVRDVAAAGDAPRARPLQSGEVIRISTGAPIPEGANAVVQVENTILTETSEDGSQELEIEITTAPVEGLDIRQIGCDIPKNSLILSKGDQIDSASIGVLATLGLKTVKVYKRAAIGLLSTGNELRNHTDEIKPGQIRDSNKLTLLNLLKRYSYEATDCGIARDNPDAVKSVLTSALQQNDVVLSTGGVSMGEFDVIKQVLVEDFGATIHFGRVNMKPGKPTTFAELVFNGKQKFVFGLPGNPVSASVTCLLFVLPALKSLECSQSLQFPLIKVSVQDPQIVNRDVRPEYVRVQLNCTDKGIIAKSTGEQLSSKLNSLVGANGLLYLPGKSSTSDGSFYDAMVIDSLT